MVTKNGISLFLLEPNQPTNPICSHTKPTETVHIEVYDEIHPYIEAVIKVLAFFDGARLRLGLACLLHYESSKYSILTERPMQCDTSDVRVHQHRTRGPEKHSLPHPVTKSGFPQRLR